MGKAFPRFISRLPPGGKADREDDLPPFTGKAFLRKAAKRTVEGLWQASVNKPRESANISRPPVMKPTPTGIHFSPASLQ
jgi:hypothetical protein